ncbi:MAG: hypothetical protein AAF098_09800 [Pseudomonadota bacterium]
MKVLPDSQAAGAPSTSRLYPALETNLRLLEQAVALLGQLSQTQFVQSYRPAEGAIGAHLRHVIEFYQCFITQWPEGKVRYDKRARSKEVETDPAKALAALREIHSSLLLVPPNLSLCITHFDGDCSNSDTTRELSYLADHATHHYALIQLVAKLGGLRLEDGFGYAPSTLANKAKN